MSYMGQVLLVLVVIGLGTFAVVPNGNSTWCYDHSTDFYPYFASRTAYQFVQGNLSRPESGGSCTPLQMWLLSRHGARYPEELEHPRMLKIVDIRDQIIRNHEAGAGRLCRRDLERLRDWRVNRSLSEETIGTLAPQGIEDLRSLGERLRKAFPELLRTDLEPGDYVFRPTYLQRSRQSLEAFQYGLLGNRNVVAPMEPPKIDSLLRPHQCPAWQEELRAERFNAERDKFTAGPEVQDLIIRISGKLGFDAPLQFKMVYSMYQLCRFELSLFVNETSVWCTIFSRGDLQILEYREDLKYYYFSGPGRELSVKLGCQTLRDMFLHFRKATEEDSTKRAKGIFYFSHSLPIQSLLAVLKFYEDSQPLTWSGFATSGNRKYRTSFFGPFSTSVIAILHRCAEEQEKYKVALYVAEKLVPMPRCKEDLCDWELLERTFGSIVNACTDEVCCKLHR